MRIIDFLKKKLSPKKKRKPTSGKKSKNKPKRKVEKPKKKTDRKPAKKKKKVTAKKPKKKVRKTLKQTVKRIKDKVNIYNQEEPIGKIVHYFGKIKVGVIKLDSEIRVGDKIHIKGAHDDFSQVVKSMQVNHQSVPYAKRGSEVGLKVAKPVHQNDIVYRR